MLSHKYPRKIKYWKIVAIIFFMIIGYLLYNTGVAGPIIIAFVVFLSLVLYITKLQDIFKAKEVMIDNDKLTVKFDFNRNKEIPIKDVTKVLIYAMTEHGATGGARKLKEIFLVKGSGEILRTGIVSDHVYTMKTDKEFMTYKLPNSENNDFFFKVIDFFKHKKIEIENTHMTEFRKKYSRM